MHTILLKNIFLKLKKKSRIRTRIKYIFSLIKALLSNLIILITRKKVFEDIVKVETYFPQKNPHGFTNVEINFLLEKINSFVSYRPFKITRLGRKFKSSEVFCNEFGSSELTFLEDKNGYLEYYKNSLSSANGDRIKYLYPNIKLRAKLAFTTFLGQTYVLAPYFKENKIPFVFTLYAGGSFGLNNDISDNMLRDIFSNKYFKKVIVNNDVVRNYLLEHNFLSEEKVEFVFGVPIQFDKNQLNISKKKFFLKDKETFDICFVAFRYDKKGASKGYDLFIDSAKKLSKSSNLLNKNIRFHVIGNYDKSVIDISDIEEKIIFHGVRDSKWLLDFYYGMDIVICANRQNVFYKGSFDGYPMAPEQSLCGVAMFQSDELNINQNFKYYKKDEIVHIKLDVNDITMKVEYYLNNIEKLYKLAEKGRKKTEKLFDTDKRMNKIIDILSFYL